MARLVLWDIDGTLVRGGGVARDVFDEAVTAVLGRHPGDHRLRMGGKTDPQIALEILAFAALEEAEAAEHLPAVLAALEQGLAAAADDLRRHGVVLPGVPRGAAGPRRRPVDPLHACSPGTPRPTPR